MHRLAVFVLLLAAHASAAAATEAPCAPDEALLEDARIAREYVTAGIDGAGAVAAWRRVLDRGGSIAWPVTEYNVDARSTFVFALDRQALRVYRSGAFADPGDPAPGGCLATALPPEAVIPWRHVREMHAANWVLSFRLDQPVEVRSDRGKRKRVKELKAYFHGGPGGDLTYHYDLVHEGRIPFWNVDVYRVDNLRGIAVGPTDYQRRLLYVIATAVDPERRIVLKTKSRGAGW
jgi:hypothetical protein